MFALENTIDFDCEHCRWGKHCDESNPASTDIFIINETATDKKGNKSAGRVVLKQNTCFKSERNQATDQWYELFVQWRENVMPISVGYLELPNYFIEVMKVHKYYESL